MSDFVASQKNISVTFDSDVEVITSDLQKLQFTSSGPSRSRHPLVQPKSILDSLHTSTKFLKASSWEKSNEQSCNEVPAGRLGDGCCCRVPFRE